jgi:SAM-dependent methyltransferase
LKAYKQISDSLLAEYDFSRGDNNFFWDEQWKNANFGKSLQKAIHGYLGELSFLKKHISKEFKVLEAGCGKGQIVAALEKYGAISHGIDNASLTIKSSLDIYPELNLKVADLMDLPYEDKFFDIYLSFGVIEHYDDLEKLTKIISEAKRVTRKLFFFSVPHFSRGLKKRWYNNELPKDTDGKEFYQYYFTKDELCNLMLKYGLRPIDYVYYSTAVGIHRNNKLASFIWNKSSFARKVISRLAIPLNYIFGKKYSHMIGAWSELP